MSAGDKRLTAVRPLARINQPSAKFVRLSQLRKLRECEQVAAVCYRLRGGAIEFLLIRTRGSGRWTFPKGGAEPGLTHAQAAALEAFEEAGVHGRIEETSFTRYVRRKRGNARTSATRSGEKEFAVNAHLCEVLRLGSPKESNRDRTWFSIQDAKRRLREGRENNDGAEFVRVVDRAVVRIQRLRGATCIFDSRSQDGRERQHPPRRDMQQKDTSQKDALQKVHLEAFAEARDRSQEASFMGYIRWQRGDMRQSAASTVDVHPREALQGEVLQFAPPRQKKAKALGNGTKSG